MTRYALSLAAMLLGTAAAAQDTGDDARPRDAVAIARELGVSDDDRRPEDQLRIDVLGREMIVGGQAEVAGGMRDGFDLVAGADDGRATAEGELQIETVWLLDDDLVTFTEVSAFGEGEPWREGGGEEAEGGVELGEAWLLRTNLGGTPFALQLGRQQLQDRREWWWDENLDMARLHYFGDQVTGFIGVGRELGYYSTLGRREAEDRDIVRVAGSLLVEWIDRNELQLLFLNHDDRSESYGVGQLVADDRFDEGDLDATWIGLRVRGRVKAEIPGRFYYWGDLARVRGTEVSYDSMTTPSDLQEITATSSQRVSGWAYDVGLSLELPFEFEPYLTVSQARGSGGATPFRQTGLHGNNGKYRGDSRFRLYGEVLRPDLSNLTVQTVALGVEPFEDGWIETVWHRYRQVTPLDFIAGSRLGMEPDGVSPRLGQELDLIASYRPPTGWDLELSAGVFDAGPAFDYLNGGQAWLIELKIARNF